MTDAEKKQLPKWLRDRIPLVHASRSRKMRTLFREHRKSVVLGLRERGYPETEIAQLLGVSLQYLGQAYPRAKQQQEPTT